MFPVSLQPKVVLSHCDTASEYEPLISFLRDADVNLKEQTFLQEPTTILTFEEIKRKIACGFIVLSFTFVRVVLCYTRFRCFYCEEEAKTY